MSHNTIWGKFEHFSIRNFCTIVIILMCSNLLTDVAGGSLKFVQGPLASALSGRSHEFVNAPNSGVGAAGGNNMNAVNGNLAAEIGSGSGGDVSSASAAALDGGPAVNGGEVLVPKAFPMSSQEPTCEQLRAMWIFSKRQSRAAEITNEIPTYRDPFAYNVWEPYYSTTRSMGAVRMVPRYGDRTRSPVFGRVVSREPIFPQRVSIGQRQRHLGEAGSARVYNAETKHTVNNAGVRRPTQYRYIGANGSASVGPNPNSVAVQGSFQKLKELIWTERAKELTQQRRAEELAARAAVLKEIANGQNVQGSYKNAFKSESAMMNENRSPDQENYQHLNDERLSIAIGQSQAKTSSNNNKNTSNNGNNSNTGKASTRSYGNKAHGAHKSSIFSENAGRSARLLLPSMISSSYATDDSRDVEHDRSSSGILMAYPLRPSHFRERNRSLFKQNSPADYFQRNIKRNLYIGGIAEPGVIFNNIVRSINQHTPMEEYSKHSTKDAIAVPYKTGLFELTHDDANTVQDDKISDFNYEDQFDSDIGRQLTGKLMDYSNF